MMKSNELKSVGLDAVLGIIAIVFILSYLTILGAEKYSEYVDSQQEDRPISSRLVRIEGEDDLYYDKDKKVVYIILNLYNTQIVPSDLSYKDFGHMSAYYAPNGLPYLYDEETKSLKEVDGS